MKKTLLSTFLFVALVTIFTTNNTHAGNTNIKLPEARGYVSDYANIIPKKQALSNILSEIERQYSIEIAVVTLQTTKPLSIEQYSVKLFEKWKIGKRGKDNGVLLLIAKNDRKVRIEVGYGLEHKLNDAKCGDIIRKVIVPLFKENKFQQGIFAGVHYISESLGIKNFTKRPSNTHKKRKKAGNSLLSIIFIILIVLLRSGMLPYLLLGRTYHRNHYWSSSSGSGGFSSGSFGGFGGGSSGGGGASGSW